MAHIAVQPRDQLVKHLLVGRSEGIFLSRRGIRLSFDLAQHLGACGSAEPDLLTS